MIPLLHDDAYEFYRSFLIWYAQHIPKPFYLEIGCANGDNIRAIAPYCKWAIGIDIQYSRDWELYPADNLVYYDINSNVYFEFAKQHGDQYDLVFIDGDHHFKQVATDLLHSLDNLAPGGLVVLHDTFPPNRDATRQEFCGDAYRLLDKLPKMDGIQYYTFPITYGLTLVSKTPTLEWINNG